VNTVDWQSGMQWLNGLLEAAFLVDPMTQLVLDANPKASDLTGFPIEELKGRSVTQFSSTPEDVYFWQDVSEGNFTTLHSDSLIGCRNGEMRHVERRAIPIPLDSKRVVYLLLLMDQTQRIKAEEDNEVVRSKLLATLESTADGILVIDLHGAIQGFNRLFSAIWQIPEDLLLNRNDRSIVAWLRDQVSNLDVYDAHLDRFSSVPDFDGVGHIVLKDARVLECVTLPQMHRGQPIGRVISFRDISSRLASEARLKLAATVFESSLDAIFITDDRSRLLAANHACQVLLGKSAEALIGFSVADILFDKNQKINITELFANLHIDKRWSGELSCRAADGRAVPLMLSLVYEDNAVLNHTAAVRCIGVAHDLTEKLADKERIYELAYKDSLTGVANRLLLAERFEHMMAIGRRDNHQFAVLFIDVDRFKHINESLSHAIGDQVLIKIAQRFKSCVRGVDLVARQSGDEFVILLHRTDMHGAEHVGNRILQAMEQPLELQDITLTVTCSIGVAMFPSDGDNANDLIRNADTAKSGVKSSGRAALGFYQSKMNEGLLARLQLNHRMRMGLPGGHFKLHYQPQIRLIDDVIVGVEALLRWDDPVLGSVPPVQFIPVAEDSGFIVALGFWVLEEAVRQAAEWCNQGHPMRVAVNVSALQFRQNSFVERVMKVLKDASLSPQFLELELTETILVGDAHAITLNLQRLSDFGVQLSIDDFGTGYSSLGYLKRLPIHRLKIDRSFVTDLSTEEGDRAIIRAVVNLAHSLKLQVIAEGVENLEQRRFLLESDCDEYQGYLCSPALSAQQLNEFLRKRTLIE
jgi:diguanylate cyclase (GGDEF)-like protein/PAS domain S-box-containing protein